MISSIAVMCEIAIVDNGTLVPVTGEESGDLLVVGCSHKCSLGDLEPVGVEDGKDSTALRWVEELVRMPSGSGS